MIDTTINLLVNRTECTNLPGTTLMLRLAVKSDNSSPAILFCDSEKLDATIKLSLTLPTALVQEFGLGKGHGGTSQRDKSQDVCHYCGETGHWAKECPMKARDLAAGHVSGGGRSGCDSGVMAMDTTLVVVEGKMAIPAHNVSLLHGSSRPPNLVNLKPCTRMDKLSIGEPSACFLGGRLCTALPPMVPMGTLLRPMPWATTLLPCPLTHLLGWLM